MSSTAVVDAPPVVTAASLLPELEQVSLLTDAQVLGLLDRADGLVAAAHAARSRLIAEATRREAAEREHLCSTATYLTRWHRHSSRQANRLVREATAVHDRFPLIAEAAETAGLSGDQVTGILTGLERLPDTLSTAEGVTAQESMLGFAADFAPDDLRGLSLHIWQTIDPRGADAFEAPGWRPNGCTPNRPAASPSPPITWAPTSCREAAGG